MSIQIRPAILGWVAVVVALLVGVRSPAWGFRLLLAFVCIALLLRFVQGVGRRG